MRFGSRAVWVPVAVVYAGWIAYRGAVFAVDTAAYAAWADGLIREQFNVRAFLNRYSFTAPLQLYLAWIMLVAFAKVIAGASWPLVIVTMNAIAVAVTARAVISGVRDDLGRVAAAAMLLLAADIWIFAPFVVSDVVFMALSAVTVSALLPDPPKVLAWPAVALACITRPAAAPLVMTLVAVASRLTRWAAARERLAASLALTITVAAVLAHAYAIADPHALVPAWLQPWFEKVRTGYAAGVAILDRKETYLAPATTVGSVVRLTVIKWLYFFSPWLPGYSVAHAMLNLAFFVPVYAAGAYALARDRDRRVTITLAIYIFLVSSFHAMQELDFDHRYRLPVLPALIMLAARATSAPGAPRWSSQRLGGP